MLLPVLRKSLFNELLDPAHQALFQRHKMGCGGHCHQACLFEIANCTEDAVRMRLHGHGLLPNIMGQRGVARRQLRLE